ncbi:hypothetical protein LTR05_000394 [Lithohypha guttulata]|uniref:Malate dehydrogenase n=1 Tax=Lithohypha guttulata TaxID=1690604 RepID=A0AAN7TBN0_9EURO|nr:hypothetical protein LTR05_000394 [Lithohypha guttulata]
MRSIAFLSIFLSSALAAPLVSWSPALGEFYAAVDRHIQIARQAGAINSPPTCDLSKAVMPVAPTPLPLPDPSWRLSEVVVGRGVQNYTCSLATKDVVPKAVGAIASLYNVSCIAANYPDILGMLPGLALEYALPADPVANLEPSNLALAGHHYFTSNGTPTFDMSQPRSINVANLASIPITDGSSGITKAKLAVNSTAPADAPKGEHGQGFGAVPWLLLNSTFGTTGDVVAVYRINTAGGKAPPTCESSPAYFSVQYATEYWFYTKPKTTG